MDRRAFCKFGLFCLILLALAIRTAGYAEAEDASSTSSLQATSTLSAAISATTSSSSSDIPLPQPHKATRAEVQAAVESQFSDIPIMIAIARCESNFRQFTDSGNVLHGYGSMVGVFQFDENIHHAIALAHGYNIDTLDGNLGYARYVYNKQGTDPWISSFSCWHNSANAEAVPAAAPNNPTLQRPADISSSLSSNLSFGMVDPQVLILQKLLNTKGFPITDSGPGSPGNETNKFGSLTRAAVRKFQCAQNITCSGDEYSTGYGYVGNRTRIALQSAPARLSSNDPISSASNSNSNSNSNSASSPSLQQPSQASAAVPADAEALQSQIAALLKLVAELQSQIALLAQR